MLTQDTRQARDYFAQKLAFVTGPFELDGQIKRREAITIVDVRLPSDYRAGPYSGRDQFAAGQVAHARRPVEGPHRRHLLL